MVTVTVSTPLNSSFFLHEQLLIVLRLIFKPSVHCVPSSSEHDDIVEIMEQFRELATDKNMFDTNRAMLLTFTRCNMSKLKYNHDDEGLNESLVDLWLLVGMNTDQDQAKGLLIRLAHHDSNSLDYAAHLPPMNQVEHGPQEHTSDLTHEGSSDDRAEPNVSLRRDGSTGNVAALAAAAQRGADEGGPEAGAGL